jgi:two-component system, cell cycle sensor histidine kinase and response regulator CckA
MTGASTDTEHGFEPSILIRVLLVEDDPTFVDFFSASLKATKNSLDLTVARRLTTALSALADAQYDAVLLDLNLPDSEGLLTLRRVAASAPEIPIVVFTGLDDEGQSQEALRLGAQDWLTKESPEPEVVVRAIRYAVERKRLTTSLVRLQKLEAVGRLAGSVAHEFNNVLTAIVGNAAFAESTVDAGARADALREIQHAAMRGALLTRQLVGVSRPRITSPAVADVKTVVATVERLFQAVLPRRIALRLEPVEALRVAIAPEHLEQILLNLILNARDAISGQGTISIAARRDRSPLRAPDAVDEVPLDRDASWARIEVRDTGHGIPIAELPRIFDSFFTTKGMSGSGLGLAISKELIEHAGGRIRAESPQGEGATLIVHVREVLPLE